MDRPSLYDDDIVTWSEQQAAALRELGTRAELSNAIDWENVAEEIESVGRSQIHAVEKLLVQTLAHLLKRLSAPSAPANDHWRSEIVTFQSAARISFENAMRQRLRWDVIWKSARSQASGSLLAYGDELLPGLPDSCPIEPDKLLSDNFDVDEIMRKLAESIGKN